MGHDKIGSFTVLAELGTGAGSEVFNIRRDVDGLEFALKVVTVETRADLKYVAQLQHEFYIGQLLNHPNIIKMYALETEADWLFRVKKAKLLLELAPGCPAQQLPRLHPSRYLRVFEQTADAISYMHSQGLLHADLKPDNIIVGPRDTVKVIDFGLVGFDGDQETRVHGTPEYMAPETKLRKVIDERTDIFNFGSTMYRLLTTRHLPVTAPGVALNQRTYTRLVVPVAKLNDETPDELCDLVHWCISYDPDERPERMSDVRDILRRMVRERNGR